jgi:hypothetical protein
MKLCKPGLSIGLSGDRFQMQISDGKSALTTNFFWDPLDASLALQNFSEKLEDLAAISREAVFIDDFAGQAFPETWDRQERVSLKLAENKNALIAQTQSVDIIGPKFERVIWRPETGDSFQRLGQALKRWTMAKEFLSDNSQFLFLDEEN